MNREPKIIKRFETKIIDLSGKDEVKSKVEVMEQISRIEDRFKQTNGQDTKTNELLFDLLREMNEHIGEINERIARFENKS